LRPFGVNATQWGLAGTASTTSLSCGMADILNPRSHEQKCSIFLDSYGNFLPWNLCPCVLNCLFAAKRSKTIFCLSPLLEQDIYTHLF
jgi:hypothetical protein